MAETTLTRSDREQVARIFLRRYKRPNQIDANLEAELQAASVDSKRAEHLMPLATMSQCTVARQVGYIVTACAKLRHSQGCLIVRRWKDGDFGKAEDYVYREYVRQRTVEESAKGAPYLAFADSGWRSIPRVVGESSKQFAKATLEHWLSDGD